MEELNERCLVLEGRNDVLSEKVATYERRVAELEKFEQEHRRAWGALNADEIVIISRAEKALLEQDPVAFMQKNHDAVFCRERMEAQRAAFAERVAELEAKATSSERAVPKLEEEIGILRRRLADQKNQTARQTQRAESLEQELAVTQYQLKTSNVLWMRAGEGMDSLQRLVTALTEENRRLQQATVLSERTDVQPSQPVGSEFVCTRSDLDSVVASLYGQINELRAARRE
jgi:chromosome segregation ATPase